MQNLTLNPQLQSHLTCFNLAVRIKPNDKATSKDPREARKLLSHMFVNTDLKPLVPADSKVELKDIMHDIALTSHALLAQSADEKADIHINQPIVLIDNHLVIQDETNQDAPVVGCIYVYEKDWKLLNSADSQFGYDSNTNIQDILRYELSLVDSYRREGSVSLDIVYLATQEVINHVDNCYGEQDIEHQIENWFAYEASFNDTAQQVFTMMELDLLDQSDVPA